MHARLDRALALVLLVVLHGAAWAQAPSPPLPAQDPLVVVTFANQPHLSTPPAGTTGRRYAGDLYGVSQTAHSESHRVAADYGLTEVASWPIKALAAHCVVYRVRGERSLTDVLAALRKDPRVTLAQPLQHFHTLGASSALRPNIDQTAGTPAQRDSPREQPVATAQTPDGKAQAHVPAYNDPLYDLQTNLQALDIEAAHSRSQGAGVRVGLIDTGVDARHPDLRGRVIATHSFIPSGTRTIQAYRHGTAMAGLIAAVANNGIGIVGIAPLARIEVFEACWQLSLDSDAAECNTFTLARALAAALDSGVPIVNISIGGPSDPLLSALIAAGLKRGIIFVGSTGDSGDRFPTATAGVIAVSGAEHVAPGAVFAVPASHVLTLHPDGQYEFESGTSVAAAQATGIIALLLGVDSHLSADRVVSLLRSGSPERAAADATRVAVISAGSIATALDFGPQRMAARASR